MTMFMPFRVSEMVALCNKTYPDLVSRKDSLDDIAPEGLMLPVPGVDYGALDGLLGYALRRAQNALYLDFYRATAAWGISPQRFAALVLIARNPGLRQGLLGQAMGLHRSGALRLTDWLTAQGYAERRDAPGDARAWGLHLTAAGKVSGRAASDSRVRRRWIMVCVSLACRRGSWTARWRPRPGAPARPSMRAPGRRGLRAACGRGPPRRPPA
jgi:hypothetical protein